MSKTINKQFSTTAPDMIDWFRSLPPMQALIPLALEGTDVGKVKAGYALAKIAAASSPEIAFPGERVSFETIAALFTGPIHCTFLACLHAGLMTRCLCCLPFLIDRCMR